MRGIVLQVLCGCLLYVSAFAQPVSLEQVLGQIEQNNQTLKTLASQVESQRLTFTAQNKLPDPQIGAFYLPVGRHNTGNYSEFQISQSFEFPSVYGVRSDLIEQQTLEMKAEYKAKRQEILLQAKSHCLNLIYLNQKRAIEMLRTEQAKLVFDQIQESYQKEQIGILELNKAKIAWMQEQFKIQQIDSDILNLLLLLRSLNGGKELSFIAQEYPDTLDLDSKELIWEQKRRTDADLLTLMQKEAVARQALKLVQKKSLPDLTAGFNYQGVGGSNYAGLYAGISIPLWSNPHQIKAAQAQLLFQENHTASVTTQAFGHFEKQYNEYQNLLAQFRSYTSTLSDLNSDQLLLLAYQSGQLSYLEYYMELQFYQKAFDTMMEMQYKLYISRNQLLKHQL